MGDLSLCKLIYFVILDIDRGLPGSGVRGLKAKTAQMKSAPNGIEGEEGVDANGDLIEDNGNDLFDAQDLLNQ
jgi:hypothetical protein